MAFEIHPVDAELSVEADPQLLASAVMNLLINAFKYHRPGGRVVLRAPQRGERVHIEVEDECGGIPDTEGDPFRPFAERRGRNRTGLVWDSPLRGKRCARTAATSTSTTCRGMDVSSRSRCLSLQAPLRRRPPELHRRLVRPIEVHKASLGPTDCS